MSEKKKLQVHETDAIKVTYDPNICEHAAECVKGAPHVFDVKKRPWIQPEHGDLANIKATIQKCPTGALTYELSDGTVWDIKQHGKTPAEVEVVPNGPLRISGHVTVKNADGTVIMESKRVSLCRCGASKNKPFCDGTHKSIGFEG